MNMGYGKREAEYCIAAWETMGAIGFFPGGAGFGFVNLK
jgi:hypothetical protein